MYIQPETNVKILKNVPLDNTYEHTLWFDNATVQASYFADNLTKFHLTNYTYQRVNKGTIRVEINANKLYDCNYLMFQNTAFGNKWFFAFITAVEYVNNVCSEITFEIDVMQTWLFDYQMDRCFVEREHSLTDNLGDSLTDENIFCGKETVVNSIQDFNYSDMYIGILATEGADGSKSTGNIYNNVYTNLAFEGNVPVTEDNISSITYLINEYIKNGKEGSIINIFQYPKFCYDKRKADGVAEDIQIAHSYNHPLDGYTPKNKKLYQYPYNYMNMSNNAGENVIYKYEYFKNPVFPYFVIEGTYISNVSLMLYPRDYRSTDSYGDVDNCISINSFPQCAFGGDTYKQFLYQNQANLTTALVGTAISGLTALATSGASIPISTALAGSTLGKINQTVGQYESAKLKSDSSYGSINNSNIRSGKKRYKFTCYHVTITNEYARIVDDYFTKFGYKTDKVKVPNRNSRPHWNYVKTIDCTLTGSVPADDMKKIISVYDNGVTFWKNGSEVGRYDLDNSPTT